MYSNEVLKRFKAPRYAGGLRGANGTGRAENSESGDLVKIYIFVDNYENIATARFKAYGGVSTIVACDVMCEMLIGKSLDEALSLTTSDIMENIEEGIPENKAYSFALAEEAVANAVEDYYKKKEKEEEKLGL